MTPVEIDTEGVIAALDGWTAGVSDAIATSRRARMSIEMLDLFDADGVDGDAVMGAAEKLFAVLEQARVLGCKAARGAEHADRLSLEGGGSRPALVGADSDFESPDPSTVGIDVITMGLTELSPGGVIDRDEIGLIEISPGRYILVLPGVIDLSRPKPGLDSSCSSRDLDQGAVRSFLSAAVDDNLYAQEVVAALNDAMVPVESELMIIGHSYGADTALDLAADPEFNGDKFRITHVLGAGYHSQPQMPSVPSTTKLLVLQNDKDLAVNVERISHELADSAVETASAVAPDGAALSTLLRVVDGGRELVDKAGRALGRATHTATELVDDARREGLGSALQRQFYADVGTFADDDGRTRIVFDGGDDGFGHHPSNYIEYINSADDAALLNFASSLAEAGYGDGGKHSKHKVATPCVPARYPWLGPLPIGATPAGE